VFRSPLNFAASPERAKYVFPHSGIAYDERYVWD